MSETIDKATDEVETYTPDAGVDKSFEPLPEEVTDYADDGWEGITDDDGNIKVELHSETILRTLAERIYSDYNSAIRELYNNEARACRMARDQFHARPHIHITLNETDRKLIIHGVDSLGITKKIVGQVLRIVGKSSNMKGGEVGQFGMGFISYSLLTDMMILETNPRLGDEYALICDGGMLFRKAPQPNLGSYGTRLEMVLKDNIRIDELVRTFEACAEFSTIPTTIELETDITNNSYSYGSDRIAYNEGTYECSQWNSIKDYVLELSNVSRHTDDDGYMREIKDVEGNVIAKARTRRMTAYKEIHIDNEDYEFFGVIAYEQQRQVDTEYQRGRWADSEGVQFPSTNITGHGAIKKVLLCKTPIKTSFSAEHEGTNYNLDDLGKIFDYALNIKDERKFMPEANRDNLSRNATEKIITNVVDDIITLLDDWNVDNVTEFYNTLTPVIYSSNNSYRIKELLNDTTKNIIEMLDTRFPTVGNNYGQRIGDLLASGSKVIYLRSLRSDMMVALRDHFKPTEVVFIRNNHHYHNQLLNEFKILDGDVYRREHKIKLSKDKVESDGVTNNHVRLSIYSVGGYRGTRYGFGRNRYKTKTSNTIGQINTWLKTTKDDDVMLKVLGKAGELEQFVDRIDGICDTVGEKLLVVRMDSSVNAPTIEDVIDEVKKKEYMTTEGKMKGIKVLKRKSMLGRNGSVDKFTNIILCDHKEKLPDYKDSSNNFTIAVNNKKDMIKLWIAFNLKYEGITVEQVPENNCHIIDNNGALQFHLMGNSKVSDTIAQAFPIDTCDLSVLKTKVEERETIAKKYDNDLVYLLSNGLKSLDHFRESDTKNKYKGMKLEVLLQQLLEEK